MFETTNQHVAIKMNQAMLGTKSYQVFPFPATLCLGSPSSTGAHQADRRSTTVLRSWATISGRYLPGTHMCCAQDSLGWALVDLFWFTILNTWPFSFLWFKCHPGAFGAEPPAQETPTAFVQELNIHKNLPIEWENHDKTIQFLGGPPFLGGTHGRAIPFLPRLTSQISTSLGAQLGDWFTSGEVMKIWGCFSPRNHIHHCILPCNFKHPTNQPSNQPTKQATKQPTKQPPSQPKHPANQTNPNQIKPSQTKPNTSMLRSFPYLGVHPILRASLTAASSLKYLWHMVLYISISTYQPDSR